MRYLKSKKKQRHLTRESSFRRSQKVRRAMHRLLRRKQLWIQHFRADAVIYQQHAQKRQIQTYVGRDVRSLGPLPQIPELPGGQSNPLPSAHVEGLPQKPPRLPKPLVGVQQPARLIWQKSLQLPLSLRQTQKQWQVEQPYVIFRRLLQIVWPRILRPHWCWRQTAFWCHLSDV